MFGINDFGMQRSDNEDNNMNEWLVFVFSWIWDMPKSLPNINHNGRTLSNNYLNAGT